MKKTREQAIEFFRYLAAGAPHSNLTWGKTQSEVQDIYAQATTALEHCPDIMPASTPPANSEPVIAILGNGEWREGRYVGMRWEPINPDAVSLLGESVVAWMPTSQRCMSFRP